MFYDEIYKHEFIRHSVCVFTNANDFYPNVDLKWLFYVYFSSEFRELAEEGNPRNLTMSSEDVFYEFERDGILDKNNYPTSDKTVDNYYGDSMMWMIMQWCDLSFKYKIKSKDLLKYVGFDDLLLAFEVGHERGFSSESEVLYDRFIKDRFNGN